MSISNSCRFIGNLVRDPELRYSQEGKAVVNICIAVGDDFDYTNNEKTQFPEFVGFGKTAEFIANNVEKGNKVVIEAKMTTDKWETEDGHKRSKIKFLVENFKPITWKDKGNKPQQGNHNQGYNPNTGYEQQANTQQNHNNQPQQDGYTGFQDIEGMDSEPPF